VIDPGRQDDKFDAAGAAVEAPSDEASGLAAAVGAAVHADAAAVGTDSRRSPSAPEPAAIGAALTDIVQRAGHSGRPFTMVLARPGTAAVAGEPVPTPAAEDVAALTAACAGHAMYTWGPSHVAVILDGKSRRKANDVMHRVAASGAPTFTWVAVRYPEDSRSAVGLLDAAANQLDGTELAADGGLGAVADAAWWKGRGFLSAAIGSAAALLLGLLFMTGGGASNVAAKSHLATTGAISAVGASQSSGNTGSGGVPSAGGSTGTGGSGVPGTGRGTGTGTGTGAKAATSGGGGGSGSASGGGGSGGGAGGGGSSSGPGGGGSSGTNGSSGSGGGGSKGTNGSSGSGGGGGSGSGGGTTTTSPPATTTTGVPATTTTTKPCNPGIIPIVGEVFCSLLHH